MIDIVNKLHKAAGDNINDLYSEAAVEIEKLRNLAIDLMFLLDHIPITHPPHVAVRNSLRGQCEKFIYLNIRSVEQAAADDDLRKGD